MDEVDIETRVTQIAEDGEVLYDSRRDTDSLENHSGRREVISALENGSGEDIRRSVTVGQDMYYYALLLKGKFACKMKLCGEKPSQSQSHAILVIGLCDERKLRAESGI